MKKRNKQWKNAIVDALLKKGFTKHGALKTADITMQNSIRKRSQSIKEESRKRYRFEDGPSAIAKSVMAGAIVVVPPKK
jgi:hypothetical protein